MAKAKKATGNESDDLVMEAKLFFQTREGAESMNRTDMIDDLRFAFEPGAQWDPSALAKRHGRPCYSYNRTVSSINQVCGDQRQVRPSGTVRSASGGDNKKTAEIYAGLIRNIENISQAESIYDRQFKFAVAGGWGAWRIVPEYDGDDTFDQRLCIKGIPNPLTVYFDEIADPFGRGAMRCMIAEKIDKEAYHALYGPQTPSNLPITDDGQGWNDDSSVRVGEYYKRLCRSKKIVELSDGRVLGWTGKEESEFKEMSAAGLMNDEQGEPITIIRSREVKEWYVRWVKIDGSRVLEGPIDYEYENIPVIRLPGRHINIEGQQYFQSLIRHSKDAQRGYNYNRSAAVEMVALTPKSPLFVTNAMITGYEDEWRTMNLRPTPYIRYNHDPQAIATGGKPFREPPPDIPQAVMALATMDAEDIRQTTGHINPALDQMQQAPESGVALRSRIMGGDSGSYEFIDNFAKAIQFTWEICVDMIPVHYDSERVVRTIGMDGKESFERINGDDEIEKLSAGKYDVVVTLGPAYATSRMEALDTLLSATERMPIIGQVAPDVVLRNLDVQGSDEIEKRVRRQLILSGQIEPTEEEAAELPPPPAPDPMQEAMVGRLVAQSQRDAASAAKLKADILRQAQDARKEHDSSSYELVQLIDDIIGKRLENLTAAQALGMAPAGVTAIGARVEASADELEAENQV